MTPRYVESEWCKPEVKEFCKIAEQSGGLVIDNKARVIKVIKIPLLEVWIGLRFLQVIFHDGLVGKRIVDLGSLEGPTGLR